MIYKNDEIKIKLKLKFLALLLSAAFIAVPGILNNWNICAAAGIEDKNESAKIEKLEKQVMELTNALNKLSDEMKEIKSQKTSSAAAVKNIEGEAVDNKAAGLAAAEGADAADAAELALIRSKAKLSAAQRSSGAQYSSERIASKTFKGGERAQQAINPEISVTFDHLSSYKLNAPHNYPGFQSGENFRMAGIHMQSEMDPYSFGKLTFAAKEGAFEMGEAYAIFSNMIPGATLTAGKFRSQFGVINRWHLPALDSCMHPISLSTILGPGGLSGKGFSIGHNLKKPWADANEITFQLQRADNPYLFSGTNSGHIPSALLHIKNYYDLSRDKYFELGLTAMIGPNSRFGVNNPAGGAFDEAKRYTKLAGLDLTYFYEPVNMAKYKNFLWRSELFHVNKEITNALSGKNENINTFGGYTYIQRKTSEQWEHGLKFDYTHPFQVDNKRFRTYAISPYVNFWQSPWVRTRFQYDYINSNFAPQKVEHRANLQLTWSFGPHKHEKY
jgi:hypothetical protein